MTVDVDALIEEARRPQGDAHFERLASMLADALERLRDERDRAREEYALGVVTRERAERERDAANARADALVRENLALAQERDEALARVRELEEA